MKRLNEILSRFKIYNVLPVIICFFMGRVRLFGFFSPVAFCGSACFGTGLGAVCAFSAMLGIISKGVNLYMWKYLFIFVAFLAVNPIISKKYPEKEFAVGLSPALATFAGGTLFGAFYGFSAYYIFVNTIEGLFAFFVTYILDRGFGLLDPLRPKKLITSEEIISLIVIFACVICGAAEIKVFGADFAVGLGALFMLMVCFKFGSAAGACCGSVLALLLNLQTGLGLEIFPILSLSGFIGGFFRGKNRGLTSAIYVVALFLLSYRFGKDFIKWEYTSGVVFAATVFLFLPDRLYYRLTSFFSTGVREPEEYIEQVYTMVENTLKSYSFSFRSLGAAFEDFRENGEEESSYNIMLDEIADRMCRNCSLSAFCWGKNYYMTYDAVLNMLISMEKEGRISLDAVPYDFKRSCMAFSNFVQTAEKIWETQRLNEVWQNRMAKTRAVMRCYLESVSELLFNLSSSFKTDLSFDKELSLRLSNILKEEKITVKSLSAGKTAGGRREILITLRNCDCTKRNTDRIIEVLNGELSERIMKDSGIVVYDKYNKDLCVMRFIGENKLHVGVKILKEAKTGKSVSGDNHTYTRLKDGAYLLALSDGMGSGKAASEESAASLDLFRDFISSGFSKEASIRLINTCLEMTSKEESFATLDACIINLYSGEASIIKTAACPTYILRNKKVEVIKGEALPVGILTDITPEITDYRFKKNDTVIMVTDGVCDSFKDPRGLSLKQVIEEAADLSYPKICENIFDSVKANYRGLITDDITVMVARIY